MKKLLAALLFCVFCVNLIACQPTPDKPIVESKNDGELEAAVYGEQAPEYTNGYENPGTWQEVIESDDGITKVNIDATLSIPDVSMYPVYRVEATGITQEEADSFINAFSEGRQLYMVTDTRTKAIIQAEIDKLLSEYEDPDSMTNKALASGRIDQAEYDYYLENDTKIVNELREEYKQAPIEPTITEIDTTLKEEEYDYGDHISRTIAVHGEFFWDKDNASQIHIQTEPTAPHGYNQAKVYYNYGPIINFSDGELGGQGVCWENLASYNKIHNLNEMELTYDEAKSFADSIVHDRLGYTDWQMNRACASREGPEDGQEYYIEQGKTNDELPEMYTFYYTPTVDGIPLLFYTMEQHDKTKDYADYNNMVYPKCLVVAIKDKQQWSIYEQSSMKTVKKLNSNAKLLPFEEIREIFKKNFFLRVDPLDGFLLKEEVEEGVFEDIYEDGELASVTYNINDIRLGYLRIPEKNNTNYGLLIPVWMFYGNQHNKYNYQVGGGWKLDENNEKLFLDDPANSFICINALDGSIIDLNLGY